MLLSLVLPSLIAAVLIFVASSLIHMVLQWHRPDYGHLKNEEEVGEALRKASNGPGQYILPHCADAKAGATPEMLKKFEQGPVGVLYLKKPGAIRMGPFLGKWFLYTVLVSFMAGYVARVSLPETADYLKVFQVVGATAWLAYAWQSPADSIWKYKPWSVTFRSMIDGFVYALLTAGPYAWLW